MYLFSLKSLFLHIAFSYCLVSFYFTLKDSLKHFLQGRSSVNKPLQHLFIWECLNIPLAPEGQFCWIYNPLLIGFFLLALWKYLPTCFLSLKFLMRILMIISLRIPSISRVASLLHLWRVSLSLKSLIIMCLCVRIFEVIELLGCLYSCFSSNLGNFQLLLLQIFSLPISLSSPSGTPTVHMLIHLIVSYMSLRLCTLFFNIFSFCSSDLMISIVLSSCLLILSSAC